MAKVQADFITRTKIILQDDANVLASDADSGTATAGSTTVKLEDTTKNWVVDSLIGWYVRIISGTGIGQIRAITDNDATTCTVATWTAPDITSQYEISNDPELKALLSDAVNLIYEKDRPYTNTGEISGDGTNYDFTFPTGFIEGYSEILKVEYPSGEQKPIYLAPEKYVIYDNGTTKKFRFLTYTPTATEKARIIFTLPHTLDSSTNTVPDGDFDAVCHLTAAIALLVIANRYSHSSAPTIGADVVEYRAKSDICRALSKEQFTLYDKAIGKKEETRAAAIIREYDTTYPWGGDLLTHPAEWR